MAALREWLAEMLSWRRLRTVQELPVRLDVGQRLAFGVPDVRGNHWYASRLESLEPAPASNGGPVPEPLLVVAWPSERLTLVPVHVGDEVLIGHAREDDARYLVPTMVEALHRNGHARAELPMLALRVIGQWRRYQERRFVRLQTSRLVVEGVWPEPWSSARVPSGQIRPLRSLNVSAGGALLESALPFTLKEVFECRFESRGLSKLTVKARVVRLHEVPGRPRNVYQAGVEFVELSDVEQDRLFRWIFSELIRRRRQGVQ